MVLGPGLTSQFKFIIINMIDPSFDRVWSPHKIDVVSVIIAVSTRFVARSPSLSGPLLWNNKGHLANLQRRDLCVASHGSMELQSESGHHPFHLPAWNLWYVLLDNDIDTIGSLKTATGLQLPAYMISIPPFRLN